MSSRALVVVLFAGIASPLAHGADVPKKVLLVATPPDSHPPGTHEYLAGMQIVAKCLKPVPNAEVMVEKAEGPWKNGPELVSRSDCVVIFLTEGAAWLSADKQRLAAFQQHAKRGGGMVCLHWGMGTREAGPIDAFVALFGGCHGGPDRKFKELETAVTVADPTDPVAAGLADFRIHDEFYYRLKFARPYAGAQPILRALIDGAPETVAWAWERPDGGRSFGFSGLHFHNNWKRVEYRRLVAQGVLWSAKLPIPEKGLGVDLDDADYALPAKK